MEKLKIKRALISVTDKIGISSLAKFLAANGVEIISTGGTAQKIKDTGVEITPIEKVTGNPEAFSGRMKTISFQIASSLLFRRDSESDLAEAEKLGIKAIDLVVCNLYNFAEAKEKSVDDYKLIEQIDIGGPTMIRAAAKNFSGLAICSSPDQYADFMQELKENNNCISLESRKRLAAQAFQLTANYESMICGELSQRFLTENSHTLLLQQGKELRYGENPHQSAYFYRCANLESSPEESVASAPILQGKALSYNNIMDADAAHRAASDAWHANGQKGCAVAVVKHMNPCGLAIANSPVKALELAWEGDPISAFGGILCFSQEINAEVANWLSDKFIELLIAPSIDAEALQIFAKKQKLRVLLMQPKKQNFSEKMIRSVSGGILIQDEDVGLDTDCKSVTKQSFSESDKEWLHFGIMSCKHLRSNAIALVKRHADSSLQLVGAGMGQPNRVDSLRMLAGPRAKEKTNISELMMVSDAFFPFPDIIEVAAELGIQSIVQPGGSIRDNEVIAACDQHNIAMALTGRRHFRH